MLIDEWKKRKKNTLYKGNGNGTCPFVSLIISGIQVCQDVLTTCDLIALKQGSLSFGNVG